ncbi:ATP-binding response regulator [Vibrio methylphosphonaticus]|uniref:ATP-binding response regulator n=1 Tax=Vibrio methylphosphonaticus TaxID=2946866 RepID=UPI00202A76AC|nr:response regulator [Vibrio methylphosphonaticus]MCL9776816.1 response regulator [Vibrio methylphosphonaticus]
MMKKQHKIYSFPVIKIGIVSLLCLSALGLSFALKYYTTASGDGTLTTPIITQTKKLNEQLEFTILSLDDCLQNSDCHPVISNITELSHQMRSFKALAALDKKQVSLVGAVEYSNVELAINRFDDKTEIDTEDYYLLRHSLSKNYVEIRNRFDDLFFVEHKQAIDELKTSVNVIIIIFPLLSIIAISVVLGGWSRLKKTVRDRRSVNESFESLASRLDELDSSKIDTILNSTDVDPVERSIYSKLRLLYEKVDKQQQDADLNQQLYGLIGYEIRGITNTIKGGIHYLIQDSDDSTTVLAQDISSAANTLSELAENYNRLLSQGRDKSSTAFSFLDVISELTIHMKTKLQRDNLSLDCAFIGSVPNLVLGHQTSLFWMLFLKLSNAIQVQSNRNVLLKIETGSSADADKARVSLSLTFLTSTNVKLAKIDSLHWSQRADSIGSNDEWTKSILGNVGHFNSMWLESGKQRRLQVDLDLEAHNYFAPSSSALRGKHIMICSSGALSLDILSDVLSKSGATFVICDDPNELFRINTKENKIDGIIITDAIEGIQIAPFSKTLNSRLKTTGTKLFLLSSNSELAQDTHEFVDKVFFSPILPHEFIPNLHEALEAESVEETLEHSSFLIVEDDKVQQFLLKRILMKQEYNADTVGDGSAAVEWVKNQRADIIFMDCIMPGMGGIQATKLIREHERTNETNRPSTIIGATALTSVAEHKVCIEAGMDYVISKPYKSDEIIKVIKKYVAYQKIN